MSVPLFVPQSTNDDTVTGASKTLLMTHHGWGKTTTCAYYQQAYGRGLILSGESGLKSLMNVKIDYLHFSSWNGEHDPARGVYSFKGIMAMVDTQEFKNMGYAWICVDSLTELGDQILEAMEDKHDGNKNKFDKWVEFSRLIIGACKWIRDLPMHVLITCLAGEETDENGNITYWPLIPTAKTPKKIPGLFDYVFCGVRRAATNNGQPVLDEHGQPVINRFVVTDEYRGWCGKARDPHRRLKAVETEDNIVRLLQRIDMPEQEYQEFTQTQKG